MIEFLRAGRLRAISFNVLQHGHGARGRALPNFSSAFVSLVALLREVVRWGSQPETRFDRLMWRGLNDLTLSAPQGG
jgi:hypothetical protein